MNVADEAVHLGDDTSPLLVAVPLSYSANFNQMKPPSLLRPSVCGEKSINRHRMLRTRSAKIHEFVIASSIRDQSDK